MRVLVQSAFLSTEHICNRLKHSGILITKAQNFLESSHALDSYRFDLAILNLPRISEFNREELRQIKDLSNLTPIIVTVDAYTSQLAATLLHSGVDDVVTFAQVLNNELPSRVKSVIRRYNGFSSSKIEFGSLSLDIDDREVCYNDIPIPLSINEYLVMQFLMLSSGRVRSRNDILDYLYAGEREPETKIIDVYICKIRQKCAQIEKTFSPISTVHGEGYKIGNCPDSSGNVYPPRAA